MRIVLALLALFALAYGANLLQTAANAGITTLPQLVIQQGLDTTLNGTGPFTVFAPTNPAFATLGTNAPSGTALSNVLTYHVVSGNVSASQLSNGQNITTVQGQKLFINVANNNVYVNGIQVAIPNVYADNGVAHAIGTVLTPPTQSITQIAIASTSTLSTLTNLVVAANLAGTLNTTVGPSYTVFAPTDAAFAALPACVVSFLTNPANVANLTQVLLYHVVGIPVFSPAIPSTATPVATLQGSTVSVLANGATVTVNAATVTTANVLATNGVVHIINSVLLPPGYSTGTICTLPDVAAAAGLTSLTGATTAAGLNATLSGTGPFTVFAPNNAAFAALSSVPTGAALTNVLTYHVVAGRVPASAVTDNQIAATVQGQNVILNKKGASVYVNGVPVITADVAAANGLAHVIGKVLTPPTGNIIGTAALIGRFSALIGLVRAAGLEGTINGTGPFTVFAPNNTAIAALPASVVTYLNTNVTALTAVLLYHVLPQAVFSSFIASGNVPTAGGLNLAISVSGGVVAVGTGGARVLTADVLANNGVIHEISGVLVPSTVVFPGTTSTSTTDSAAFAPAISVLLLIAAAMLALFQ